MPLPAAVSLVPLHGQILRADSNGTPAVGTVEFRIEQPLRDGADLVIMGPGSIIATLDETGSFTVSLIASDDPDLTPTGWTYAVSVNTDVWKDSFRISVPAATVGTLEFATLTPVTTPTATATYVLLSSVGAEGGPAGPLSGGVVPASQVPLADPASQYPSGVDQFNTVGAGLVAARWDHGHALATVNGASGMQIRGRTGTVGPPTSGTWSTGDAVVDPSGVWQICTAGGTPGTWVSAPSGGGGGVTLATTTPSTSAVGIAGAVGTGTTAARADHVHGREGFGAATAQTAYGAVAGNGTATTVARSDHMHGTPALPTASQISAVPSDSTVTADPAAPLIVHRRNYAVDQNSRNTEEIYVNGVLTGWRNEWGAYRGMPAYGWDAVLRMVANSSQTGNIAEYQNNARTQVLWGVNSAGRVVMGNGTAAAATMAQVYVAQATDVLPGSLPAGLPANTVIVQLTS